MIFRSKVDRFFIIMLLVVIFSIGLVTLGPLFIEKERTILPSIIMSTIFILCTSFFAWITFGIKYVFTDEYLLVKGGPFHSKIRYENITKVAKTTDIFTGFRLLTSKSAIEIFYMTASLGSVKISLQNAELFLIELENRISKRGNNNN
ncbi:hypothetical protein SAFG77S_09559 [Streptomyces afghaniensis]